MFQWTQGMWKWQHCQNCFAKKPAFYWSLTKGGNVLVSAKIFSSKCSAGHVECLPGSFNFSFESFLDTQKRWWRCFPKFWHFSSKSQEKHIFKKIKLLHMLLWSRGMPFSQLCKICFAWKPETLSLGAQMFEKFCFCQLFCPSKCSTGHLERLFGEPGVFWQVKTS